MNNTTQIHNKMTVHSRKLEIKVRTSIPGMSNQTQDRAVPFTQNEAQQLISKQNSIHLATSEVCYIKHLHSTTSMNKKTFKNSGNNCSEAENFILTPDVYTANM